MTNKRSESVINDKNTVDDPLLNIEIMKNISEGIYLIKVDDNTIIYTNEKFEKMFGYNSGEMIGKNVSMVNAPSDKTPEQIKESIVDILSREGEWHGEIENIKKDGTHFWCYANVSLFKYSDYGKVIVSVHTDITEKKKIEAELKFKNALLTAQQDASNNGVLVVNEVGKIINFNKQFSEMWGIPQEVIKSGSDEKALNFVMDNLVDPKEFLDKVNYLYENKSEISEDEVFLKDGKVFERYSAPVLDDDKIYYGRVWRFRDITERKQLQEQVHKDREELEIIFDSIPSWIYYKDTENRFIKVNQAFAEVMNMSKEQLEGKPLIDIFSKEQAETYWQDDKEVIKSNKPKRNIVESMDSPRGLLWVQTDKIPYVDKNNKVVGVIGFTMDITSRKLAEEEVKERSKDLEKINSLMVGRELKMAELKNEIKNLEESEAIDK